MHARTKPHAGPGLGLFCSMIIAGLGGCKSQLQTREEIGGTGRSADGSLTPGQQQGQSGQMGQAGQIGQTGNSGQTQDQLGSGLSSGTNPGTALPGTDDTTNNSGQNPNQSPGSSGTSSSGTGSPAPTPTGTMSPTPQMYPALAYHGEGKLFNDGRDFKITQDIRIDVDDAKFRLHVDKFRSSTDQVDKKIKTQVGTSTYFRTPQADLDYLARQGFANELYAIFADSVTARDGTTYVFSKPLPAYIVPAVASRYDTLAAADKVYTARVNGGAFNVTMTLHLVSRTPTEIVVTSDMVIAEDNKGNLYDKFPLNRRNTYRIDPIRKVVRRINALAHYPDDGRMEKIELEHRLCSETYNGKVENFACTF